jgi:hypothetical protein
MRGEIRNRPLLIALLTAALTVLGSSSSTASTKPTSNRASAAVTPSEVPQPHLVQSRAKPTRQDKTELVEFDASPFPYEGTVPRSGAPFLDVDRQGRRGHRTPDGTIHWLDETYADRRVLLHIPRGFDLRRPGLMVLFFHGHRATLERDVLKRQRVAEQVSLAGVNAVLVAPQLAFDAADSSAGKLWEPGGCGRLLAEAAMHLSDLIGSPKAERVFASLPVVIIGYSGGYLPAAACLQNGKLNDRVRGLTLLDGLYGEIGTFTGWLVNDRSIFFISSYTGSTQANNMALKCVLEQRAMETNSDLTTRLTRGSIAFLATSDGNHRDFVTHAWVDDPVADVLRRATGFAR